MLPEATATVEIKDRKRDGCMAQVKSKMRFLSVWLYDELSLEEFPHGDPPIWCEKIDKGLRLGNIEREPGTDNQIEKNPIYDYCFVRIYNDHGIILTQFDMNYHEITKGWNFNDEDSNEQSQGGERINNIGLHHQEEKVVDENSNSINKSGGGTDRLLQQEMNEMKRQHQQDKQQMSQEITSLRSMLQSLLDGHSSSPSSQRNTDLSLLSSTSHNNNNQQHVYSPVSSPKHQNDFDDML